VIPLARSNHCGPLTISCTHCIAHHQTRENHQSGGRSEGKEDNGEEGHEEKSWGKRVCLSSSQFSRFLFSPPIFDTTWTRSSN
jgi:hypothetical protein